MSGDLEKYIADKVEKGSVYLELAKKMKEQGNQLPLEAIVSRLVRYNGIPHQGPGSSLLRK